MIVLDVVLTPYRRFSAGSYRRMGASQKERTHVHIHFPNCENLITRVTLDSLLLTQEITIRELNTKTVIIVKEKIC